MLCITFFYSINVKHLTFMKKLIESQYDTNKYKYNLSNNIMLQNSLQTNFHFNILWH